MEQCRLIFCKTQCFQDFFSCSAWYKTNHNVFFHCRNLNDFNDIQNNKNAHLSRELNMQQTPVFSPYTLKVSQLNTHNHIFMRLACILTYLNVYSRRNLRLTSLSSIMELLYTSSLIFEANLKFQSQSKMIYGSETAFHSSTICACGNFLTIQLNYAYFFRAISGPS